MPHLTYEERPRVRDHDLLSNAHFHFVERHQGRAVHAARRSQQSTLSLDPAMRWFIWKSGISRRLSRSLEAHRRAQRHWRLLGQPRRPRQGPPRTGPRARPARRRRPRARRPWTPASSPARRARLHAGRHTHARHPAGRGRTHSSGIRSTKHAEHAYGSSGLWLHGTHHV